LYSSPYRLIAGNIRDHNLWSRNAINPPDARSPLAQCLGNSAPKGASSSDHQHAALRQIPPGSRARPARNNRSHV
jgi:hypothetical protein